jgi:DNA ligase-1
MENNILRAQEPMEHVFETIKKLRETPSLKLKQSIITENDTPELRRYLISVLNPYKTFGIDKLPILKPGITPWTNDIWEKLDLLETRKLTGNAARAWVTEIFTTRTPECIDLVKCVLHKDLSANCGVTLVNKAIPALIPEFKVSLAHPFEANKIKAWPVLTEFKLDGLRTLTMTSDDSAAFYSRAGNLFETMAHLIPQVQAVFGNNWAIDSEAITGNFEQSAGDIRRKKNGTKNTAINLWIFDLIPLTEFLSNTCSKPLSERRKSLEYLFNKTPEEQRPNLILTPQKDAATIDEIMTIYSSHLEKGLEGTMIKRKDSLYEYKRSHDIMKLKPVDTIDLIIEGIEKGEGEAEKMVGRILTTLDNGLPARIGAGKMKHEDRIIMLNHPEQFIGRVFECGYQMRTGDGMLRFPRFLNFRDITKNPGGKE